MGTKYIPRQKTIDKKIGKIYGRLQIIKFHHLGKGNNIYYLCKCRCGKEKIIIYTSLSRGATRSCGCLKQETEINSRLPNGEAAKNTLYRQYKKNAKQRKIQFSLSFKNVMFLTSSKCFYCGSEPETEMKSKRQDDISYFYNGIDRVDNTKGYTLENVVSCCQKCNYLKSNFNQQDFLNRVKNIYEYLFAKKQKRVCSSYPQAKILDSTKRLS